MATKAKLNLKFVLILIVVGGFIMVSLGGMWFLYNRSNGSRNYARGEELLKRGDLDGAFNQFGRAVNKEPSNQKFLRKMEEVLVSMRPTSRDMSRELYAKRIGLLNHEVNARSTDPEVHLKRMKELLECAEFIDLAEIWQDVRDAAGDIERRLSANEPKRAYARLYRGMANIRLRHLLQADGVQQALDDLNAFVAAYPDQDEGWGALINAQMLLYGDMRRSGESRRADDKLVEIDQLLNQAMKAAPNGADVAKAWVIRKAAQPVPSDPAVAEVQRKELEAGAQRLVDAAATSTDLLLVEDIASVLRRMSTEPYMHMARDLLVPFVKNYPERLDMQLILAQTVFGMDDLDAAEKEASAIIAAGPLPVGYLSRFQFEIQAQAASLLVDSAYRRWELASPLERPALLPAIATARDNLNAMVSPQEGAALRNRAEGKVAFAQGDYSTAAARFEDILKSPGAEQDYEILTFAGISLQRLGEPGMALDRIKAAHELQPRNVGLMVVRAALEAATRQYDDAMRTIDSIERLDKGNESASKLKEQIVRDQKRLAPQENLADVDPRTEIIISAGVAEVRGDVDGARRILVDAQQKEPNYLSFIVALVGLEANAGNFDVARGYLEMAKKIAPDNPTVKQLEFDLTYIDPIEKVEKTIDLATADEAERVAYKYVSMMEIASSQDGIAKQLADKGDDAGAKKSADLVQRARARAAQLRQSSPGLDDHPSVIESAFGAALKKKDWAEAERLQGRAAAVNADQSGGLLFKGRMEMERGQNEQAVRTFIEARDRRSFSAIPWRFLGLAYYSAGNLADAKRCLEEAYHRNPNDLSTIRVFVPLLRQSGDNTRALLVLREARSVARNEPDIVDEWMTVEALAGDVTTAMRGRQDLYRRNPANHANAIALATLLAETEPRPEQIVDASGRTRFDNTQWNSLPASERENQIAAVRAKWLAESGRIIDALEAAGEKGLDMALLRAKLLRAQGLMPEGEQVIKNFIDKQDPKDVTIGMYLALAEYQRLNAQYSPARETLEKARQYQDPKRREADRVLGDLYFSRMQFAKALDAYNSVLEAQFDRQLSLRAVESMLKLEQFDEASSRLAKIVSTEGSDEFSYMLDAAIHETRADALYADGKTAAGDQESAAMSRLLDEASKANPASALPVLARARNLVKTYRRTGQSSAISDAQQALERAIRLGGDSGQVSAIRVDMLLAQGDTKAAIGELRRLIAEQPDNINARRNLIQLLLTGGGTAGGGNVVAAIEAVKDAINFNPSNSSWYVDLGDLLVHARQFNDAISAYAKSYDVKPETATLIKLCGAMLQVQPPNCDLIIHLVQVYKDDLNDPFVRGIYARALAGKAKDQDALNELRTAYTLHRKQIAEGAQLETLFPWFVALRQVISMEQRDRIEAFVMEVCGQKPDYYELHQLSMIWAQASPGTPDYRRAIDLELQAIKNCPAEASTFKAQLNYYLGSYYTVLKEFANAAGAFEQVVATDTKNFVALNDLAYILATELNNPARAEPFARRAVELKSNDPAMLDTLGVVLIGVKKCDEAEEYLRRAVKLKESATNYLHLAQALACADRADKARTFLKRALELQPDEATKAQITHLIDDINRK